MIIDARAEFSNAQAVTATAISANVLDLGALPALRDLGPGEGPYLVVQTETTCTDSGSDATLTLTLESDSTADLATSATVHYSSGAIAFASFAPAGSRVAIVELPHGNYERYLGVRYTIGSGPLTAGKFDAFLTLDPAAWQSYPDAI